MSHITNVMRKEIREMLTPGSVASILLMVILFAALGGLIGGEVEKSTALPEFGMIAEDTAYYEYTDADGETIAWNPVEIIRGYYGESSDKVTIMDAPPGSSPATIVGEMEASMVGNVMVLPTAAEFAASIAEGRQVVVEQYYIYTPTGVFGTVSSELMNTVVDMLSNDLSRILVAGSDIGDYDFIIQPLVSPSGAISTIIDGEVHAGVTPMAISNTLSGQTMMIPLVIMIIIMMVGSIVISSMGSEKENKTLETLLTLPVKRTSIVAGKIVAAAVIGLAYGLAYMVGMSIYIGSMNSILSTGTGSVDLSTVGMSLDPLDWVLVMLSMFLAIICALGICMILGAFSKNYKSAQTMTMPLSILAMVPMFVIMFTGWYGAGSVLQTVCFAIPFSHPMMAMQSLMNGDIALVLAGIVYMAVFAVVTVLITVRLYNSDVLITGLGQNKWVQRITGKR